VTSSSPSRPPQLACTLSSHYALACLRSPFVSIWITTSSPLRAPISLKGFFLVIPFMVLKDSFKASFIAISSLPPPSGLVHPPSRDPHPNP
ncbi:hypothetical protein PIB30_115096, partial [Stylosanthes scabra]|nr:hypothetical protein [Stylosanthes scabra]